MHELRPIHVIGNVVATGHYWAKLGCANPDCGDYVDRDAAAPSPS